MNGTNTGGILGAEFSMAAQVRTDNPPYKILLPGSPLCSFRTCWGLVDTVLTVLVHLGNRDRKNAVLQQWCNAQNTAESVMFSIPMMEARVAT